MDGIASHDAIGVDGTVDVIIIPIYARINGNVAQTGLDIDELVRSIPVGSVGRNLSAIAP
jgi:hypothetical protein